MQFASLLRESKPRTTLAGPLYYQIHDLIRERILTGDWSQNDILPNEAELAREYQVSIGTMRKALELLGQAKLITRKQGLGTFITRTLANPATRFCPWMEIGLTENQTSRQIIACEITQPTKTQLDRLALRRNCRILSLVALETAGTCYRSVQEYSIPTHFGELSTVGKPTTDEEYELLMKDIMSRVVRCVDQISIASIDEKLSKHLDAPTNTSILRVERTGYAINAVPLLICTEFVKLSGARYTAVLQ